MRSFSHQHKKEFRSVKSILASSIIHNINNSDNEVIKTSYFFSKHLRPEGAAKLSESRQKKTLKEKLREFKKLAIMTNEYQATRNPNVDLKKNLKPKISKKSKKVQKDQKIKIALKPAKKLDSQDSGAVKEENLHLCGINRSASYDRIDKTVKIKNFPLNRDFLRKNKSDFLKKLTEKIRVEMTKIEKQQKKQAKARDNRMVVIDFTNRFKVRKKKSTPRKPTASPFKQNKAKEVLNGANLHPETPKNYKSPFGGKGSQEHNIFFKSYGRRAVGIRSSTESSENLKASLKPKNMGYARLKDIINFRIEQEFEELKRKDNTSINIAPEPKKLSDEYRKKYIEMDYKFQNQSYQNLRKDIRSMVSRKERISRLRQRRNLVVVGKADESLTPRQTKTEKLAEEKRQFERSLRLQLDKMKKNFEVRRLRTDVRELSLSQRKMKKVKAMRGLKGLFGKSLMKKKAIKKALGCIKVGKTRVGDFRVGKEVPAGRFTGSGFREWSHRGLRVGEVLVGRSQTLEAERLFGCSIEQYVKRVKTQVS